MELVVDVHTHIFPPSICRDRQACFEGEAAFRLLYDSPKSRLADAENLISAMDAQGVDVSVTFGFPWRNAERFRRHNDYVLESVARYPDRLVGLCCLDAAAPEAAAEVERCLDAGLSGAGELAFYQEGIGDSSLRRLEPVMQVCAERNAPVMIHTNEPVGHRYPGKTDNTLAQIYNLCCTFPENRIILAHWGGGIFFYRLLKKEVREKLANVFYDTAASPFLYNPEIYPAAIAAAGIDSILLGTDYPLIGAERYFAELDQSGISAEEKNRICGRNAAELFGLFSG